VRARETDDAPHGGEFLEHRGASEERRAGDTRGVEFDVVLGNCG